MRRSPLVLLLVLMGCGPAGSPASLCDTYLGCLQQAAPGAPYDQAMALYGPSGACGQSTAARQACEQSCQQAIDALRQTGASCGNLVEGPPGPIGLTVLRASQSSSIRAAGTSLPAATGSFFWSLEIRLDNGSLAAAPLVATLFSLKSKDGLEFLGGAQTATVEGGCPQNASVSPGERTRCMLVFSLPQAAVPTGLRYRSTDGGIASASVTPRLCTRCGSECSDLSSDADSCGACGAKVGLGECSDGAPVCSGGATLCGSTCVDLQTDPKNCGRCGVGTGTSATCQGGTPTCSDSARISCGGACVYRFDDANCGACGHDCGDLSCQHTGTGTDPSTYFCAGTATVREPCNKTCGALTCTDASARYQCSDGHLIQFNGTQANCSSVPPATAIDPGSGQTCTFVESHCDCQ